MKILIFFLSMLICLTLLIVLPPKGDCQMTQFKKMIIKHRANLGGDCEDRDNCMGIIGKNVYNYHVMKQSNLKKLDNIQKGNLNINKEGLQINESTLEMFGIDKDEIKDIKNIHQYIEFKRNIKGSYNEQNIDIGYIENEQNSSIHEIENITNIRCVKNVKKGRIGQVNINHGKIKAINSDTVINRKINLRRNQSLSIGGITMNQGTVTNKINSNTLIK